MSKPPQEKKIVERKKHTLSNGHDASMKEIGEHLGINRESVRLIEMRAMRKFKLELEKRGYRMEDFFK